MQPEGQIANDNDTAAAAYGRRMAIETAARLNAEMAEQEKNIEAVKRLSAQMPSCHLAVPPLSLGEGLNHITRLFERHR